jgi:peptide/nickel transport system substrate-binding protein
MVASDGTPFTADAAAFTFLRTLDEKNEWYQKTGPFPFAKYIWPYVVPDQIRAVDARTLRFQLSQPDSTFLDNLTWAGSGIISPPALQKAGRDFTLHPVGAGPFKFSDWQKGTSFTIERYDNYWGGAPLLDKVVFKPVEESAARLVQLQSGNVDLVVALPPEFIADVKADPNLNLIETPGIHIWWITFNVNDEHLKDKRVRQAHHGHRHADVGTIATAKRVEGCGAGHAARACARTPLRRLEAVADSPPWRGRRHARPAHRSRSHCRAARRAPRS